MTDSKIENPMFSEGDSVQHVVHGWLGKVSVIDKQHDFPLCVMWEGNGEEWYRLDGRMIAEDLIPSIRVVDPEMTPDRLNKLLYDANKVPIGFLNAGKLPIGFFSEDGESCMVYVNPRHTSKVPSQFPVRVFDDPYLLDNKFTEALNNWPRKDLLEWMEMNRKRTLAADRKIERERLSKPPDPEGE